MTSTEPIDFKIAKVKPFFKKNKKTDVDIYRPVSILNTVSKVLEKAIHIQHENHLIISSKTICFMITNLVSDNHFQMTHALYIF